MPGRLIAQINASLDGYIEDEKHDIDWHFVDDEYEEFINETLRSLDGMIFGRKAYEPLSAYWPTAAANPDASVRHFPIRCDRLDLPAGEREPGQRSRRD